MAPTGSSTRLLDPGFRPADLTRAELAVLGREYMLAGQINDRTGLGMVRIRFDQRFLEELACDEWIGASPVYTRRTRRALGFDGDDVATIMKGLQLDCGFAHQYMDVHYALESPTRGTFWLRSCGALLDVEPFGEEFVVSMCHAMEDPTFDATAVATNPRARVTPIHRPPRLPAGRTPHCHWQIDITAEATPLIEADLTKRVGRSLLANIVIPRAADSGAVEGDSGGERGGGSTGRADYSGPFDPDFQLEDLGHEALVTLCSEIAVQTHLLVRSFTLSLAGRVSAADVAALVEGQWTGSAWIVSERLKKAFAPDLDGLDAVVAVLRLHPAFQPAEYTDLRLERPAPDRLRILIPECPARAEGDGVGWIGSLTAGSPSRALDALVRGADRRARCVPAEAAAGELAWDVVLDDDRAAEPEPLEVEIGKVSKTSTFAFERRSRLLG